MTTKKKSKAMRFMEKVIGGPLTIAKLLTAIREGEGQSQAAFARKLGISRSNLCDIEKGRRFISEETAEHFAKILKESKEQFIRIAIQDRLHRAGLRYKVDIEAA